ncbi:hypothetical protein [Ensifer sp. ZNC0028]|uniref:hypothetical protein n=1 Tax=Ensifer sp. ZNC0028 TaxID=1339236 RepID=UPI0005BB7A4C|nr:hypothetical protein [Ensifer sp. ZNC0028]
MAITAEFRNTTVAVVSQYPLLGTLDLAPSTGDTIEVLLDRPSAEALLSTLALFLLHDDDAVQVPPDLGDFSL